MRKISFGLRYLDCRGFVIASPACHQGTTAAARTVPRLAHGQRTVPVILLEISITPALAGHALPGFINGERGVVGVAMDQLKPAALAGASPSARAAPARTSTPHPGIWPRERGPGVERWHSLVLG